MLCERCEGIEFKALPAQDKKASFHILHHSRASWLRSLAKRCALCTLISSQLGEVEVRDDVCDRLKVFMVLKRRRPPAGDAIAGEMAFPVNIHSRLGFGTLSVMDALPAQYRASDYESRTDHRSRKRKRDQTGTSGSSRVLLVEDNDYSGDPPSCYTGSRENMEVARHWIKDCLENHDMCASGSTHSHSSFTPTRLVDTKDPKRPFLQADKAAVREGYIALSYAWGSGERFITTQANFEAHRRCIPLAKAPNAFTQTFQVTRDLGYRYIWIDALCIIQNDNDDLGRELATMGEIYRHATFTIFAAGAPDVFAGLFQKRDPYLYRPCTLDMKTATDEGVVSERVTLGTVVTGPNYLKKRGWVLQEEVLSSRSLLFGKQLSWQCTASEASETRPAPRPRKTALTHGRATCEDKLKLWLYAPSKMGDAPRETWWRWNQYDAWYSVMEEYSIKNLSFAKDQLQALSGLADLFHQAHHATYLAGLWREDLQLGLAWYVASNEHRPVKDAGAQRPSWSWASVGMVRLKFRSWAAFSTHVVSQGAEILDASCTPLDKANPHGGVDSGTIKFRTRIKKLGLRWSASWVLSRTEFSHGLYSGPEGGRVTKGEHPRFPAFVADLESGDFVGEAALDRAIRPRPGEEATEDIDGFYIEGEEVADERDCEVWCALLHVQETSDNLRFTALVLDRDSSEPTTYRRLGLLFLDDRHVKDVSFSNWDMQMMRRSAVQLQSLN
ncbi:heterokaryon incompatibility protein-domain-containing protein [Xylaria digitata]|nr:heterokaryon incompatibility protein-domain-containing protein [Xylaria digitata]